MKFPFGSFLLTILLITAVSCGDASNPPQQIKRENLFNIPLGKMEDQIDLFQSSGMGYANKTRLTMRDGLFFIGNGNSGKITEFSSYGDLLSMIYNPETNPVPVLLKQAGTEGTELARKAIQYPFISPGEIVVSGNQQLFVEDTLPSERKVVDEDSKTLLENIIIRFSPSGEYLDFLGQEGIGGTPVGYVTGLFCTAKKEIVVVTMTQKTWDVFWFAENGNLLYSVKINRDALPLVTKEDAIPTLERIVPDMENHLLYLKLDYYKESFDPQAKVVAGIEFDSSWVWIMDPKSADFKGSFQVPSVEKTEEDTNGIHSYHRVYELIGATAGNNLFFMMPDDNHQYVIMIMNILDKSMKRAVIEVSDDEMYYNSFHLSETGILSSLFATQFEAKVVWWRLDKLIGDTGK